MSNIDLEKLPREFNVVKEENNEDYMASRRVEFSRVWAKLLLSISTVFNIISIILIIISIIISLNKPEPDIYLSTPSGKIYPLNKVNLGR